jgi:hypothetical protein
MSRLVIGIDPGVNTGFAVWHPRNKEFVMIETLYVHEAMERVLRLWHDGQLSHVVFEDARLRTWFGPKGREALQGAGSIKRDCTILADFLGGHNIPFKTVSPLKKGAKVDAKRFSALTKYEGRTSEHARDAAMLVFGAKEMVA